MGTQRSGRASPLKTHELFEGHVSGRSDGSRSGRLADSASRRGEAASQGRIDAVDVLQRSSNRDDPSQLKAAEIFEDADVIRNRTQGFAKCPGNLDRTAFAAGDELGSDSDAQRIAECPSEGAQAVY